ncbi:MAG: twin-arginine translocase TatA/TatE family subunit [Crocinitomicaceae bacterium]|jgi:sec-independent protein translocase protein TatA
MLLYSGLILAGIGPTEIILILVIVLLFFGGKKIPELMKGLGQGMKEFKDASKGEDKKTTASTEVKPEDK